MNEIKMTKKSKLSLVYRLYYIIEKETTQMKINFYSNSNIENFKKKKNGACVF